MNKENVFILPSRLGRLCVCFPPEGSRLSDVSLQWANKFIHTPFNWVLDGHITHRHTGRVKNRVVPHSSTTCRLDFRTPSDPWSGAFHQYRGWCWNRSRNRYIANYRTIHPFILWPSVHSVAGWFKKRKLLKVNRFHWRFRFRGALFWALEPIRKVPGLGRTPLTGPRRRVLPERVPINRDVSIDLGDLGDWFAYCDTGSAPGSNSASDMRWSWSHHSYKKKEKKLWTIAKKINLPNICILFKYKQ